MEKLESAYGSDKHGLVWGYLFAPGYAAREIDTAAATRWLSAPPSPDNSFVWLHWSLSNTSSERWLRGNLDLPDTFFESLRDVQVSTRLEQDGSSLVAVIHDVLFDASFDASDISTVTLCIQPKLLITARLRPLRSVDRLRAEVKSGHVFRSSSELLSQLLRDQAEVLIDIIRTSTVKIDAIEDQLLSNRVTLSRRDLGSLRRSLVRLQRLLAPEPAAFFRLLNRPPVWITSEDLQDLRQAAEEFSTAVVDSVALVERLKLLQEELTALTNEQTSKTLFVLTVVTVLALPINLVAGLFGMNVGGIPLAAHQHGFFVVISILALITAVLAYLAFGRDRD